MQIPRVLTESWRFYDGGVPADGEPPNHAARPRIQLLREPGMREQTFRMQRRIGYRDRELGDILVPDRLNLFDTDLTSVPALFTWLVPKDGAHLQAALLHDGLYDDPSYVSAEGHDIDAIAANRIFRDAMADTGTGTVRRWLMWAAVTTETIRKGQATGLSRGALLRYRVAVALMILFVVPLGVAATTDFLDSDTWIPQVPWMPEGDWYIELAQGLSGALVIPFVLAVIWGRFFVAGVIVGISLAVLLHVTVVLVAITLIYQGAERIARWRLAAAAALAALILASAAVVFLTALA